MGSILRVAVSKKKRRYQKNGFDLDLTYVTPRIIAMGFPSENVEAAFRNPMKEVLRFLDSFHKDHYKVYNLCSERSYDREKFYNRVEVFPFEDHNAPPFELILQFCQNVEQWLDQDDKNIAVIHCKAGKGRTGLMISAWMVYSREWATAKDALTFYAAMRTYNQKGVTIPSQIRYVHYFADSLINPPESKTLLLSKVIFHTLPKVAHIPDISFSVNVGKTTVFNYKDHDDKGKREEMIKKGSKVKKGKKDGEDEEEEDAAIFDCGIIPVFGDIKLEFTDKGSKLFAFWFCSSFVKDNRLILKKEELDKAHKDTSHKSFHANFRVELSFSDMSPSPDQAQAQVAAAPTLNHDGSASADSSSLSSSSYTPTPSSPLLANVSEEFSPPTDQSLPAIASSSVLNGEWVLNKDTSVNDDKEDDVVDNPNELAEKLISTLLQACKAATRGGTVIETHTYIVRSSPIFREFLSLASRLSHVKLDGLDATEAIAFWLNVHNTLTLHSRILLADTPKKKEGVLALHQSAKYRVGGRLYSGSDIEIGVMRAPCPVPSESPFIGTTFAVDDARRVYSLLQHDTRILFALYRGTESCPPVRVYRPATLHAELDENAKLFLEKEAFVDVAHKEVYLPKVLFWHRQEFGSKDLGVKEIVKKYLQVPMPEFWVKYNPHTWEFEMHPHYGDEKESRKQKRPAGKAAHKVEADIKAKHTEDEDAHKTKNAEDEERRDREREKRHKKERRHTPRVTADAEHEHEHRKEKREKHSEKERERKDNRDGVDVEKEKHPNGAEKEKHSDRDVTREKHSHKDADKARERRDIHRDAKHGTLEKGKERHHHRERGHGGDHKEEREHHKDREHRKERDHHRERERHKEREHRQGSRGEREREKDALHKARDKENRSTLTGLRVDRKAPPPKEHRKSMKIDPAANDARRVSL